ncbi:O-antigen ligase family protein [Novosphingobium huizhouense]|uniref:O-antigen ligase family protein n=1 Tax=Novosphingobium huizhouense TaxID=2866625 RepID=UPI001CD8B7C8|nr:O-antigen ligase family protein [Novosphingobium huizhouense]
MNALVDHSRRAFDRRLARARDRRTKPGAQPVVSAMATPKIGTQEPAATATWMEKSLIGLFLISLCLPLSGSIGPLRLPPSTAFLLIAFLPMCFVWLVRRRNSLSLPDLLVWLFWLWATAATIAVSGLEANVQAIGLHLLQTIGAFAVGRVLVRNAATMRAMITAAILILAIATPFALYEFTAGRPLILQLFSKLGPTLPPVQMTPRLGFQRVQAFLEHPILFGIFSATLMTLVFVGLRRTRPLLRWAGAGVAILNAVLSLSTGALLAVNMQFGLLLWNRLLRSYDKRWHLLAALTAIGYVALDLVTTKTPFHTFVRYATFNSGSSFNRIRIWEYGTAEVGRHPLFGIGMGEWERPSFMSSSMDNFWLVQAVRYGLPALLLIASIPVVILLRSRLRKDAPDDVRALMLAGNVVIVSTAIAIFSVHIWNSTYVWWMFLLGACVWFTLPGTNDAPADKPARGVARLSQVSGSARQPARRR